MDREINFFTYVNDIKGQPIIFGERDVIKENGERSKQPFGKTIAQIAIEVLSTTIYEDDKEYETAYNLLSVLSYANETTKYDDEQILNLNRLVFKKQPLIIRSNFDLLVK